MLPRKSLILYCTLIRSTLIQFLRNLEAFSSKTSTIASSSGIAPVNKTGYYIYQWSKILRVLIQFLSSYANHLGIIAKSRNVTLFSLNGKCLFNCQTLKERIFWSYLTVISNLFGHSNSLCAKATRAIINYVPIGEYHVRFFPKEEFSYLCGLYSIKTR